MNRYDILQGKGIIPTGPNLSDTTMGIDLGDGDYGVSAIYSFIDNKLILLSVQPGQTLKVGDPIRLDSLKRAVLSRDTPCVGFVTDPHEAVQMEQNQNSTVVGRSARGRTNRGFLHEHIGLQQTLKVDSSHIIVDRDEWERARFILSGEPDNLLGSSPPRRSYNSSPPDLSRYYGTNNDSTGSEIAYDTADASEFDGAHEDPNRSFEVDND